MYRISTWKFILWVRYSPRFSYYYDKRSFYSKRIKVSHAKRKGTDSELRSPSQPYIERLNEQHQIMWQGLLGLKTDYATVQVRFISGSLEIGQESLLETPKMHLADGIFRWCFPSLKMNKKMSIENLEVNCEKQITFLLSSKIFQKIEYHIGQKMIDNQLSCTMVALPCGPNEIEVQSQTECLREKIIDYLSVKQYAGIIEIPRRLAIK